MGLLIVVGLIASGCASGSSPEPSGVEFRAPAGSADQPAPAQSRPATATGILDFTAPKLGGGQVVGSEFAGQNVAIWFWAPW